MTPRSGFSLVELLCAILVLGIGLSGLIHGITTALQSSKEAEVHTTAALLAAGRMELLRAEEALTQGSMEGTYTGQFSAYSWKEVVEITEFDDLFEVRVAVLESESGKLIYDLDTLVFQPPLTEEDELLSLGTEPEGARR